MKEKKKREGHNWQWVWKWGVCFNCSEVSLMREGMFRTVVFSHAFNAMATEILNKVSLALWIAHKPGSELGRLSLYTQT